MTDSGSDNLRDEPNIDRVRDMYSWAYAWRTRDGEDETNLSSLREKLRAEFDRAFDAEVVRRVAEAKAEAWDEGHKAYQRRNSDSGCECGAWNEGECACGRYGTGTLLSLMDNPYRAVGRKSEHAELEVAAPCTEFHWLGQTLASCDACGRPYWVHETYRGEKITDAAAVERKWATPRA